MREMLKHRSLGLRRTEMSMRKALWIGLSLLLGVPKGVSAEEPTGTATTVTPVSPPAVSPPPTVAAPPAQPADSPPVPPAIEPDGEPPPLGYLSDGTRQKPKDAVPFAGVVREKGSRDPLPAIRVTVTPWRENAPAPSDKPGKKAKPRGEAAGEPIEVTTDAEGNFLVEDLAPGMYQVLLRGGQIQRTESIETLAAGKKTSITYYAPRRTNQFELVVRAEPVKKEVSEQVLSVQELKRIPGTQNDAIKAVQNLPGVARAPFGGGLLVVWGSAPADTRVYADGVQLPRIFHFAGFRSTINSEFVDELSFKPGAYGADFGRGLGGMIDVTTRSPKSDRIHGSVTLDLIDGSVTLEGPVTKNLYVAGGVRVSWISVFLPIFNRSQFQVSPFYWDYQLSMRYRPTKADDIDVFIFGSTDNLEARVSDPDPAVNISLDTRQYFSRARVRWTHRFSSSTQLIVMPSIGGDVTRFDTGDGGIGSVSFKLEGFTLGYNLRSELRHRFAPWLNVIGGVDFEGSRSSFEVVVPPIPPGGGGSSGETNNQTSGSAITQLGSVRDQSVLHIVRTAPYAIARFDFLDRRLTVSPQIRLETAYIRSYDGDVSRTVFSPEPRLVISGQVVPKYLLLKFGVGAYSQLGQPQELNRVFGNPNLDPQRGTTYVAGFESEPTGSLFVQGQFFYKDLRSLIVSDPVLKYTNAGLGRVIGGDFLLRQKLWKGLFGWLAYTISQSERKSSPQDPWRLFRYDQTHILTAVASYKLPWFGIEVGVRFRYVTGGLYTPTTGAIRDTLTQTWVGTQGDVYSARLPDFHQLDLRVDKTWTFNRWKLGLYLDIQNLYNRQNAEQLAYGGRQLYQTTLVTGIPFFPNFGLRADF
ncbi:MAG TPA: TonB-dependent receptor [Pseudomonadota bacterium]|nr:TonB-dependent receptor [Pseudomonadota bacterium]HNK45921.1 TonB-dependent receptor [Pseudomonadota bacterium]HNO68340.1 TonB-dependent receptor [Pseudomonadota bacterium]